MCHLSLVTVLQKLYAVCDLALGLVMTKSTAYIMKDFPADPVLPAKLFTNPDSVSVDNAIWCHCDVVWKKFRCTCA